MYERKKADWKRGEAAKRRISQAIQADIQAMVHRQAQPVQQQQAQHSKPIRMSQATKQAIGELIQRDYAWFDPTDSINQKRIRNAFSLLAKVERGEAEIKESIDGGKPIYLVPSSGWYGDSPDRYTIQDLDGCPTCSCDDFRKQGLRQKESPVVLGMCKHILVRWLLEDNHYEQITEVL